MSKLTEEDALKTIKETTIFEQSSEEKKSEEAKKNPEKGKNTEKNRARKAKQKQRKKEAKANREQTTQPLDEHKENIIPPTSDIGINPFMSKKEPSDADMMNLLNEEETL